MRKQHQEWTLFAHSSVKLLLRCGMSLLKTLSGAVASRLPCFVTSPSSLLIGYSPPGTRHLPQNRVSTHFMRNTAKLSIYVAFDACGTVELDACVFAASVVVPLSPKAIVNSCRKTGAHLGAWLVIFQRVFLAWLDVPGRVTCALYIFSLVHCRSEHTLLQSLALPNSSCWQCTNILRP